MMNTRPDPRDPRRRNKMFKEHPISGGKLSAPSRVLQDSAHSMTQMFFDLRKAERMRIRPR